MCGCEDAVSIEGDTQIAVPEWFVLVGGLFADDRFFSLSSPEVFSTPV